MILVLLLFIAVALSLLLAAGALGWCIYLLAIHHVRRAALVLGVGSLGGVALALLYYLLVHWLSNTPANLPVESILVVLGIGFGWAGFGAAVIAQLAPLFCQLFGQSNSWSARRAKNNRAA
jgi:hypothetical protein